MLPRVLWYEGMTICFANGKGGSGKTTVTLCVAMALTEAGKRVAIADRDPQGTAGLWVQQIASEKGPFVYDENGSYDVVLIDTPPRLDHPQVREAILAADKVILVTSPSPTDLWTTKATADLIKQLRPGFEKVALLFNQVQIGTMLGRQLDALAAKVGLSAIFFFVKRRQCYQHAALMGWGALVQQAREEIEQITLHIVNL